MQREKRFWIAVVILVFWWALLLAGVLAITVGAGELPVDYRTYVGAAEALSGTGSPYLAAEGAQETWRAMHDSIVAALMDRTSGRITLR